MEAARLQRTAPPSNLWERTAAKMMIAIQVLPVPAVVLISVCFSQVLRPVEAWTTTKTSVGPTRTRRPFDRTASLLHASTTSPSPPFRSRCRSSSLVSLFESQKPAEEWSDFDDLGFVSGSNGREQSKEGRNKDEDSSSIGANSNAKDVYIPKDDDKVTSTPSSSTAASPDLAQLLAERTGAADSMDWTAIQTRQFSLGPDLVLSDYVGSMGFDEVTDWEYYYPGDDDDDGRGDRQVVQPNPFDASKPRRTRTSSGSVVRIFRGEFVGTLGGTLSAQGMDRRVLVKEFSGELALGLARGELASVGRLQSKWMSTKAVASRLGTTTTVKDDGEWRRDATSRSVQPRKDQANMVQLVKGLLSAPFLGIYGEVNLAELDDGMEPNEFYRALGVPPPKPDAVWIVYEYAGLSTVQAYAVPAAIRRARLPPQKGFFGNPIAPPPLPDWSARANYVVNGIVKGAIVALANLHEIGVVHRSIGRSSVILTTKAMDKREPISPFNTATSALQVKLADFGFSGPLEQSTSSEEFCTRARSFGLNFRQGDNNCATANFAMAEDMHAIGFVFLGLLLTSLAELPDPDYQMPATDEDTLQRLLGEIFEKDFVQFREYVEADEIWTNLVALLDADNASGWKVLETLVLAREKAAKNKDTDQLFTIRGLLSNPFFSS